METRITNECIVWGELPNCGRGSEWAISRSGIGRDMVRNRVDDSKRREAVWVAFSVGLANAFCKGPPIL